MELSGGTESVPTVTKAALGTERYRPNPPCLFPRSANDRTGHKLAGFGAKSLILHMVY